MLRCDGFDAYGPAFVCDKYRGYGIHSVMLSLRCKYLKSKGFKYVLTTVQPSNIFSIKGLKKASFESKDKVYKTWLWFGHRFYKVLNKDEAKKYIGIYESIN